MASAFFRFKQFTVWHDKCAMKVGTDGVLLGAWCPLSDSWESDGEYRVLDIGTGSGLIALMLAQRTEAIGHGRWAIDAIDIDADAVAQAQENFAQSPWAEILHAHQSSLQDWLLASTPYTTHPTRNRYDLIVSNPPYFQQSLKNPDAQRAVARHTDSLTYNDLIAHAARMLKANGTLALVLPFEAKEEIIALAQAHALTPTHITHVHSKPGKPAKRLLIAFSPQRFVASSPNTFYIESADSPRSNEYKELTRDFYL